MRMTTEQKIEKLKAWCITNYNQGADTMIECWDDAEYTDLLDEHDGNYRESLKTLKKVCAVEKDRYDDAVNSVF